MFPLAGALMRASLLTLCALSCSSSAPVFVGRLCLVLTKVLVFALGLWPLRATASEAVSDANAVPNTKEYATREGR